MYFRNIQQLKKILSGLTGLIEKAEAHATEKNYDAERYVHSFLAPDQFDFARQIQSACDLVKFAAARLSGQVAPSFEDNENSLAELKARISKTLDYLNGFEASAFDNCESQRISLSFMPDKTLSAEDYLVEFVLPNFYFHSSNAYAILRHHGVPLGKRDFLVSVNFV